MFDKINSSFEFHKQAIGLREERQQVLANNIANVDTPNFKAVDFDFGSALKSAISRGVTSTSADVSKTSDRHLAFNSASSHRDVDFLFRVPAQPSLDGNTVEMDQERTQFLDNSVRYQASLVLTSSYIQGLKTAIQSE